jgi:tetratricopeptide (TPR) repeat protein
MRSAAAAAGLANPFPGLRPFREEEEYLFFGREGQVDTMVDKLATMHFLAVIGTSGSGKSSLVNCGLRPSLRRGGMARAGSSWRMAQFRPGGDPIKALARSLAEPGVLFSGLNVDGEVDGGALEGMIEATLEMSSLGLVDLFEQAQLADRANLLLIVDQFEELFRYTTPPFSVSDNKTRQEASVAFVNLLLEAYQSDCGIYIVLTMRSDFLGDCARFPGLPEAVNEGQFLIPRLTREERRAAIAGPIAVGGGEISPVLLTRLVNDVGDNPDQLSILQHALNRTWAQWQREGCGNEPISPADYEAIGTMAHALDQHAERAFAELKTERQRRLCEVIFQALTEKGGDARGIRRPTDFATLCAIANASPEEVEAVLEAFRKPSRSFLMPPAPERVGTTTVIDISHESLMRVWKRLNEWVEREAESGARYRRLVQSAALYAKGSAGLMTDPELAFMLKWQQGWQPTVAWAERYDSSLSEVMEFLDRSQKERDRLVANQEAARKKKLRQTQWVAAVLGALAAIALCMAYVAWRERSRAEANLQSAKEAVDASLMSAGSQQAKEAADLPEIEKLREELLAKAEIFYARIAQQNSRNQGLQFAVAEAHSRLGDINRLLEKPARATQEYNQAIADFESLARDYPDRSEYRQALAYSHNWLGETMRIASEQGAPVPFSRSDVERQYDEALRLQQQLHMQKPADSIYQQELARTYYNRGILRFDNGDLHDSEADFRQAIELLEPLAERSSTAESTNPPPSQDLARVDNNLAVLLGRERRTAEAVQFSERATRIQEGLSRNEPDNREYKMELAQWYFTMATLLGDEGKVDLAAQENQQAMALFDQLAEPAGYLNAQRSKARVLRDWLLK